MKNGYSWKKGFGKSVTSILGFAISAVIITGFADVQLWDLVVQYVKPLLSGVTVGGSLVFAYNFVKYNWMGETKES